MFDKLKDIAIRYEELEGLLSSSEVVGKQGLYQRYAKEHADLRLLV
jgi:peptide chain release factor 1